MGENVGDVVVGLDDGLGVGDEVVGDAVGIFVGLFVVGSSVSAELFVTTADEFVCPAALDKRLVGLLLLSVSALVIVGLIVGGIKEGRDVGALLPSSYPAPPTSSSYRNPVSSFVGTDVGSSVGSAGIGSSVGTGVGASV